MKQTELYAGQMSNTRKLVAIPLFAAIAVILQYLEFPIGITNFLKLDFGTLPGVIGGLMFGPAAGIMIELIKNLVHMILKQEGSFFIGEMANFIAGVSFILPAVLFQRLNRGKTGFAIGLILGTFLMTVIMSVANYYVLLPAYAVLSSMSLDAMLAALHFESMWSIIIYAIAPFNLIKGVAVGLVSYPIYVKLSGQLRFYL